MNKADGIAEITDAFFPLWMSRKYYRVVGIFDWGKKKRITKEYVKFCVCGNLMKV